MKRTFTKQLLALLALLPFVFISCSDDEGDPAPSLETDCQITKITFFNNGVNDGSHHEMTYNSQGFITKLESKEGLGNQATTISLETFSYNSQNQLMRVDYSHDSGNEEGYTIYEYNANGTVSKISDYNTNTTLASVQTITYDANKRATQIMESQNGITYKTVFEYVGTSENVSKRISYDPDNQVEETITYENYDDKPNPAFLLKGFPKIGESRNNPKKVTETSVYSSTPWVTNFTYSYNNNGLVSEIIEKMAGSTDEHKSVFTYNCN